MKLIDSWRSSRPRVDHVEDSKKAEQVGQILDTLQFERPLPHSAYELSVLRNRGQVLGRILTSRNGDAAFVHFVDINSEMRRQGLGRRMVKSFLREVQLKGVKQVYVSGRSDEGFWALLGFRPIEGAEEAERLLRRVNDHPSPECVMMKSVPPLVPANPFR